MSIYDTTQTTTTQLPSWFSDAQKNLATQAGNAMSSVTPFDQTAAAGALSSLTGQNNPLMQSISSLQGIASGAANPWLPDGTPNKQTALGGLFSAQNAQLNQMLPGITAKEGAAGIGGGAFGSLRGQTATETARGGALTTLAADQMRAALEAQQQGIQANSVIGNIGSQYGTLAQNLSKMQLEGNLPSYAAYENILGAMGPTLNSTVNRVSQGSDMENIAKTLFALQQSGTPINKVLNANTGVSWLDEILKGVGTAAGNQLGSTWDSLYNWMFGNNGYASWNGIDDYIS